MIWLWSANPRIDFVVAMNCNRYFMRLPLK
jgi:hypothetical protein